MKTSLQRFVVGALLTASIVSSVSCYSAYPPPPPVTAYQDAKGYEVPHGPAPAYAPPPRYGVDPGVVVAGVAAAGLLGYALGNNHNHYYAPCYGPRYYGPVYRGGYYGPRCYR